LLVAVVTATVLAVPASPAAAVPAPFVPWSSWEWLGTPPGIPLLSSPAATSWGPGHLDVYARGDDGALWHRWKFADTTWSEWHSLGGSFAIAQPAVVSWGPGRIDVFMRGNDSALWHNWFDQNTWHTWHALTGPVLSAPAVASRAPGRLDVFVRGPNEQLWQRSYVDSNPRGLQWSPGWVDRGGMKLMTSPAATSSWPGAITVIAKGTNNRLYFREFFDNVWYDWAEWPQQLFMGGSPSISSEGQLRLCMFVRGGSNNVLFLKLNESVSNADLGAFPGGPTYSLLWQLAMSTPASVSWGVGRIDLFVVGGNRQLYHRWTDGA